MSKPWIVPIIVAALIVSAFVFLPYIGTSKRNRIRHIIWDTIEGIGVFCLWLIRLIPKSVFIRIPVWLGIPLVINGLLVLFALVVEIAKPFFREVFGAGRDKSTKPVDEADKIGVKKDDHVA